MDLYDREFSSFSGQALPLRLGDVRRECGLTEDSLGNVEKVLFLENLIYRKKYNK